jgi:hypothetical protein
MGSDERLACSSLPRYIPNPALRCVLGSVADNKEEMGTYSMLKLKTAGKRVGIVLCTAKQEGK